MKKTILAGIAGAAIAGAIGFAAPAAQAAPATPCSYFGDDSSSEGYNGICGAPDLANSILNAGTNLQSNFDPSLAGKNLQKNFNAADAASNLQHALTNGVGTNDPAAP
jgi:hypothetical protein